MGYRVCSTPGCPTLHQGVGKCPDCKAKADKQRRPQGNPYRTPGHRLRFREGVLARNPRCVCTDTGHGHDGMCGQLATIADHYPIERVDLVTQGADPDDPKHGRGLCKTCHDKHTAATSPGGWNARDLG